LINFGVGFNGLLGAWVGFWDIYPIECLDFAMTTSVVRVSNGWMVRDGVAWLVSDWWGVYH